MALFQALHFNNAGASIASSATHRAMIAYLDLERTVGPYEAANRSASTISDLRRMLSQLYGLKPENTALTDSGTRGWNTLIYGLDLHPGDEIVVSQFEFGSCLAAVVDACRRAKASWVLAPSDVLGRIDVAQLPEIINRRTRCIAVAHAATHLPILNNIQEISRISTERDIPLIIDATQTIGLVPQLPLPPKAAIVGTGRKWLRGPRGTGFVVATNEISTSLHPPTADLANSNIEKDVGTWPHFTLKSTAQRFEIWEKNYTGFIGLHNAVQEYTLTDPNATYSRVLDICAFIVSLLSKSARSRHILADAPQQTGSISFDLTQEDEFVVRQHLDAFNMSASIMSTWDAPYDFSARSISKILRISPHYFNDEESAREAASILNLVL